METPRDIFDLARILHGHGLPTRMETRPENAEHPGDASPTAA